MAAMGSGLPSSINLTRTIGIVLTALSLHSLGATEAAAQLRGVGVPSVGGTVGGTLGGAVGGAGSAVGGVSSGVGSAVGGSGIGGSGIGGTDFGVTDLGDRALTGQEAWVSA